MRSTDSTSVHLVTARQPDTVPSTRHLRVFWRCSARLFSARAEDASRQSINGETGVPGTRRLRMRGKAEYSSFPTAVAFVLLRFSSVTRFPLFRERASVHDPFPGTTRDHHRRRRLRRPARLQLLQHPELDFRVTLIEKRSEVGRGLAYHTGNPDHLLNVRAANMSALPDDPDHFWRWLSARADAAAGPTLSFVPARGFTATTSRA